MIQGMQMLYDRAAHTSNWHVGPDGTATANPLRGNVDVARLRKKHRVKVAEAGRTSRRAMPITEEHVCKHFRLLLRDDPQEHKRAWALHAAWVVGLHCGLRFDELSKLQFDSISLAQCVRITLPVRTKNSITHKTYDLDDWFCPDLDESHAVDAISAVPLADYSCLWGWPYLFAVSQRPVALTTRSPGIRKFSWNICARGCTSLARGEPIWHIARLPSNRMAPY
jgi:hypothetical protein